MSDESRDQVPETASDGQQPNEERTDEVFKTSDESGADECQRGFISKTNRFIDEHNATCTFVK